MLADRTQLLEAAERLIRSVGPHVTMEAIAAEATVTKPILYRNVGDKDALVTALAERFIDRVTASTIAALVATKPVDARDGLRRFVGSYVGAVDDERNLYLFVAAGGSGEDRLGQMLQLADRAAAPIVENLTAQRSAVSADPVAARAWAYGIIGSLQFVTLWWLRDQTCDRDEVTEHITALLWAGMRGETRRH